MKEIKLNNGLKILVDNEDYGTMVKYYWRLKQNKGTNCKYAVTYLYNNGKQKTLRMHRLIMNPKKEEEVDHINGDGLDNRKENLRIVSHWQNVMNTRRGRNNTSGFKGVIRSKNKWTSKIQFNKKKIYIGQFKSKVDAAIAYDKKARELFGEFANLNFI